MIFLKNKKNAGFTIIELILAIAIFSFGIVGIYSAFAQIYTITYTNSLGFTASYLGQEGLEVVRNIRDNNLLTAQSFSAGLTGTCGDGTGAWSTGCEIDYTTGTNVAGKKISSAYGWGTFLNIDANNMYSYSNSGTVIPTIYKRKITISTVGGNSDVLQVTVLVTWSYNGNPYSFTSNEYLYNWY